MDLQDMRFALCIARHQNLTKAARELYVSQPTLSKCLQKLEEEAHGKLFTRIDNRYCPTYLGEQYLNYARSVLALERQWKQTVADVDALQEGELNIALPLMRSYCILPKVVTAFREKYPRFTLNIYEESTGVQEKLLLDSKIDFAIFNELFPSPNLQYDLLKKEEILSLSMDGSVIVCQRTLYSVLSRTAYRFHCIRAVPAISDRATCCPPDPKQPEYPYALTTGNRFMFHV